MANAQQQWNQLDLDSMDDLLKEVEKLNETLGDNTFNDADTGINTRSNRKSSGDGKVNNERSVKASRLQADIEDEEDETEDDLSSEESETELDDGEGVEDSGDGSESGDADTTNLRELHQRQVEENRRLLAELEQAKRANREAEAQKSTLRKGNLEAQRDRLGVVSADLKAKIKSARELQDFDSEEELREKLYETNLRKMAVEQALEETATSEVAPVSAQQDSQTASGIDVPAEAQRFITRNAWIASAPVAIRQTVAAQAQILIDSGEQPDTVGFYDKLEKRLERSLEGTSYKVVPRKTVGTTTAKKGSPVGGRPQATEPDKRTVVERTKDGKTKVKVTREDIRMAEALGFDNPKDYIRSKIEFERQTDGNAGSWSQIKIG